MARMRKKRNIPLRMEVCSDYWFTDPTSNRKNWRKACGMPESARLYLEIGCGKGAFCCQTAESHPEICYIALERDASVILAAIEKAASMKLKNIFFVQTDAQYLSDLFSPGEIDRIYINFCDPWIRKNKSKRRLTHRNFLAIYKDLLSSKGEIHFKTDEPALFAFSIDEFWASQYDLDKVVTDLHHSKWSENNVQTEFEKKFANEGFPIYRLEAHVCKQTCIDPLEAFPEVLVKYRKKEETDTI